MVPKPAPRRKCQLWQHPPRGPRSILQSSREAAKECSPQPALMLSKGREAAGAERDIRKPRRGERNATTHHGIRRAFHKRTTSRSKSRATCATFSGLPKSRQ
jgi:hypothetical protein